MKSHICLVIGYGSIGKRHVEVLNELGYEVFVVSRRKIDYKNSFKSIQEAFGKISPNYIIIANETSIHLDTFRELVGLNFTKKIFIEKPIFHTIPDQTFSIMNNVFVGYDLRFHPLLKMLKNKLANEVVISAQIYVGQYLPLWRPNTDYRNSYSAKKELGGGSLRDLSHELDFMIWLLGFPISLSAIGGKFSSLEINSDDSFALLLKTTNCPVVTLQVNYLDRIFKREIIINTNNNSFHLDFVKGTLQTRDELIPVKLERNFIYKEMHKSIIESDKTDCCTFEEGINVLKVIKAAELASKELKWVKL